MGQRHTERGGERERESKRERERDRERERERERETLCVLFLLLLLLQAASPRKHATTFPLSMMCECVRVSVQTLTLARGQLAVPWADVKEVFQHAVLKLAANTARSEHGAKLARQQDETKPEDGANLAVSATPSSDSSDGEASSSTRQGAVAQRKAPSACKAPQTSAPVPGGDSDAKPSLSTSPSPLRPVADKKPDKQATQKCTAAFGLWGGMQNSDVRLQGSDAGRRESAKGKEDVQKDQNVRESSLEDATAVDGGSSGRGEKASLVER
jgi:hypothetical protein